MEQKPSYYAIIPARVRYADIKANAKLIYGEITALANQNGYCWASNEYFGDLYGVSSKQVSLWVKELADNKFVKLELVKTKEGTIRRIYLFEENLLKSFKATLPKGNSTTPKGNVGNGGSTTPKGNTNNILNNKKEKGRYKSVQNLKMPDLGTVEREYR